MEYSFRNIIGTYAVDKDMNVIAKDPKGLGELPEADLSRVIFSFKDKKYFSQFFSENLRLTKQQVKESVGDDLLIIQSIRVIDDLTHVANILAKRLREWYELYDPDLSRDIPDHETFVEKILEDVKKTERGMGADLSDKDIIAIRHLAEEVQRLYLLKEKEKGYIDESMRKICPNLLELTGPLIGAKLMEHAGSLRHLSEFPASTIQLLGAEKALFKHIRSGAKCPKYGLLFNHPFVVAARPKLRGKAARLLSDKLSIAAKIDYFKGDFIGDRLKKQLEEKGEKLK